MIFKSIHTAKLTIKKLELLKYYAVVPVSQVFTSFNVYIVINVAPRQSLLERSPSRFTVNVTDCNQIDRNLVYGVVHNVGSKSFSRQTIISSPKIHACRIKQIHQLNSCFVLEQ